ncbi:Mitochondrial zinc maintenance protein 1, mitochondrial [Elasticomyces elasticus]|uniref:Mitochondrial zinc maintenance protein 1, mitochondrial n=1 Tax=Exophiala sideris TaxID=1016849 RepID=A0ABR0JG45_9EURO|nr:Mitochondrial zinc maintenance protein 1, mitochondrial [Elasticomyces elasticus]KAK5024005.1 Mitochondrial zinc maintenance protein 1, mitochondrial [Exophiala sideris]KAK5025607.1 Mitochondrial zinc maintenance protein 1, mitochondrial [Exophiala sideris]KAK5063668.1 Mitochondrial zinc maintenance protein 1, mitochondrial [Exophiala sideris]KAK5176392.1 Mitochondrial zinc maintenance protein 1, mitochondrial [Eurotiomycetes sp. CCFEE 6388]
MAAKAAYRHLLRATRVAFEGDYTLLHAARVQARTGFDSLSSLDPSSEEAQKQIQHAEGVASILRHNLVQGQQVEGSDAIKLNIHKDIERGDNDTVKNPLGKGGKVKVAGGS